MIAYKPGTFLKVPKAEVKIPVGALKHYEDKGWWLQVKKNGASTEVIVPPAGHSDPVVALSGSSGQPHKAWAFSDASRAVFEAVRGPGWRVFYAELLHSKVSGLRDTHYVYDCLAFDNAWLLGVPYASRYQKLLSAFQNGEGTPGYWKVGDNIWVTRNIRSGFRGFYEALEKPEDEGVVLKDPNGVLGITGCGWAVKCRRPHKNFGF